MKIKKSVAKVQWSLINPSGISNPFDGTPFLCVGTIIYHCHQGNDVDVKTKQKRQEERDQKEVNWTSFFQEILSCSKWGRPGLTSWGRGGHGGCLDGAPPWFYANS